SVGSHTYRTTYNGDSHFTSSFSPTGTLNVGKAATISIVVASPSTVNLGQAVTISGSAFPVAPGAGTPTGPISFYVDSILVGSINTATNSNTASITLSNLSLGKHSIT